MAATLTVPLVRKELRQVLRGHAAFALQNLYLLAIGIIAVAECGSQGLFDSHASWEAGASAFWLVVLVQAALGAVVGATLTASAVTSEHEQKTFDVLASAPLTEERIIWGKLLAGIVVGGTVLLVSAPIAAACFLLGGIPLAAALWAYVLLYGTLVLSTALGLCCSVLVKRTAAAVPLAVTGSLVLVGLFASFQEEAPAVTAISPCGAANMLAHGQPAPLFGHELPVWVVSLAIWSLATLALTQAATQCLKHPHLRRLWPVRWRLALLLMAVALLAAGSLGIGPRPGGNAPPPKPDDIAINLAGYLTTCAYLLLVLIPVFAAGLPTPLDRRRLLRQPLPSSYRLWERLFGHSVVSGGRYLLLLLVACFAVTEAGLFLWGNGLAGRWSGCLALAFVPAAAAIWAFGILGRLVMYLRWPRTDDGRRFLSLVLTAAVLLAPVALCAMMSPGKAEPTATVEFIGSVMPSTGIMAAFPTHETSYASDFMKSIVTAVPGPVITAVWQVLLGCVLLVLEVPLKRRWRRVRQEAEGRA